MAARRVLEAFGLCYMDTLLAYVQLDVFQNPQVLSVELLFPQPVPSLHSWMSLQVQDFIGLIECSEVSVNLFHQIEVSLIATMPFRILAAPLSLLPPMNLLRIYYVSSFSLTHTILFQYQLLRDVTVNETPVGLCKLFTAFWVWEFSQFYLFYPFLIQSLSHLFGYGCCGRPCVAILREAKAPGVTSQQKLPEQYG